MVKTTKESAGEAKAAKPKATKAAGEAKAAERTVKPAGPVPDKITPRLYTLYVDQIRDALKKEFSYKNVMQIPRIEKIVINMGIGDGVNDSKLVTTAAQELTLIAGQKAVVTRAKKSIATYKLREGLAIGCKVTLRKQRMYEFLDRLVTVALPRVRDFRGVSGKSFDGKGNYTLGLKEQLVFPEINYDKVDKVRGMDITFVTTARTDAEAKSLLRAFQLPFIN